MPAQQERATTPGASALRGVRNAHDDLRLVKASTRDDALTTGKTLFDRLVGADPHATTVFDYHVTFDEDNTSIAGKARWGDLPTAVAVDSDDGQDLLDRGWEATKEDSSAISTG